MLGHQLVDVVETPVKGECNTIIVSSTLLLRNNLHSNIIFNSTNALSICRIDAYSVVVHGIYLARTRWLLWPSPTNTLVTLQVSFRRMHSSESVHSRGADNMHARSWKVEGAYNASIKVIGPRVTMDNENNRDSWSLVMHATITLAYHLFLSVPSQGTWNLLV